MTWYTGIMTALEEELPLQDPKELAERAQKFLDGESGLPTNVVRLAGKPGEEIATFQVAVALYPTGEPPAEWTIQAVTGSRLDWRKLYHVVKGFNLAEETPIFTDTSQGPNQIQVCRDQGWPAAVVALGLGEKSGQLVADLIVINGLSPAETLAALKNKIDQRFIEKAGA